MYKEISASPLRVLVVVIVACCLFTMLSTYGIPFFTVVLGGCISNAMAWSQNSSNTHINYTTVKGYFLQDEHSTNVSSFNFITSNFGLINQTYNGSAASPDETQWQYFAKQVKQLNKKASPNVHYKVLFMGRHGEGYHNAAETYYGTPAWNCYYSELDGNSTVTWADAHLTPNGVTQALAVNKFWASEIENQKIPLPQSYYTSPLTRCLATANLTFSGLKLRPKHPFIPTVKELFREGISGHTCDRRSSKTYVQNNFPTYKIEEGFTENDQLWEALHGETNTDQDIRSKAVLDDVFSSDKSTYISITSHSGEIASILRGKSPIRLLFACDMLTIRCSIGPPTLLLEYRSRDPSSRKSGDDRGRS